MEYGLSMLAHASMPLTYWNEAFCSAIYLINRLPSYPLGTKSPYELLFSEKPNYMTLKTFGYLCFPNLRAYNKHKLQFRSTPCTFLGCSPHYKGYKCREHTGKYICQDMSHVMNIPSPFKPHLNQQPKLLLHTRTLA